MSRGGFLIKFDNKKNERCYSVSFDYDKWEYSVNGKKANPLPPKLKSITVKIEEKAPRK